MYDVYRHTVRSEFRLTIPHGAPWPQDAKQARWRFVTKRYKISKLVADEIARTGFAVTKPIVKPA